MTAVSVVYCNVEINSDDFYKYKVFISLTLMRGKVKKGIVPEEDWLNWAIKVTAKINDQKSLKHMYNNN